MTDEYPTWGAPPPAPKRRGTGLKIALVGVGVAAGAIVATAIGANATTGSGTTGSGTGSGAAAAAATASNAPAPDRNPADRHGAQPVRNDEKSVSAAIAAKLKAAALKAVPGGTVYRVETDSGDAVYEAHMTKADGTEVTVKFDKNLAVTGVEAGMGK
ncbi:MAG TPA: hypothetical protein VFU35_03165 [Jatrophihabitans sp.]|nr:hypothetical protein [Jatrophihabitans sp.]